MGDGTVYTGRRSGECGSFPGFGHKGFRMLAGGQLVGQEFRDEQAKVIGSPGKAASAVQKNAAEEIDDLPIPRTLDGDAIERWAGERFERRLQRTAKELESAPLISVKEIKRIVDRSHAPDIKAALLAGVKYPHRGSVGATPSGANPNPIFK